MKNHNDSTDPQHIYRQLKLGLGHELVNDQNVFALIALARQDGHQLLEKELREWRVPCNADDSNLPSTIAPTPGFNKTHVKH
jgi:hypothetical protein